MFSGARKIMAWLNHSANLVTRNGEPLLWITPLGLPVCEIQSNIFLDFFKKISTIFCDKLSWFLSFFLQNIYNIRYNSLIENL